MSDSANPQAQRVSAHLAASRQTMYQTMLPAKIGEWAMQRLAAGDDFSRAALQAQAEQWCASANPVWQELGGVLADWLAANSIPNK